MAYVPPKKRFGQHYLNDDNVILDIVDLLEQNHQSKAILEIGPGMGALTQFLWPKFKEQLKVVEVDKRCAKYLRQTYEGMDAHLIEADFLKLDLPSVFNEELSVIGNFPYNISSQIVFKIIESELEIPLVVGMFQREVALRLAGKSGSKAYGVISILAQLDYEIEVAFHIGPEKFTPPPKVVSSVLTMKKRAQPYSGFDRNALRTVVKTAFHLRRKKLSNALKSILQQRALPEKFADKRAEALSIEDFIELTNWWQHG